MVKLIFFCVRRPELSHDQYVRRLLEGHVPLALRHHPTMRRYVVNVVEQSPPGFPACDSIGELSFDDLADFRERLYDSPEGRAAIERDVASFLGGAHAYVTREYVRKDTGPSRPLGVRASDLKMICPIVRRDGMSHDEFVRHWFDRHVPIALEHHPGQSRYVTNVVDERLGDAGEALDGIAELVFPSAEALATGLFASAEGERIVRADIARFIGRTGAYRVAEYVQR